MRDLEQHEGGLAVFDHVPEFDHVHYIFSVLISKASHTQIFGLGKMENEFRGSVRHNYSYQVADLVTSVEFVPTENVNKVSCDNENTRLFEVVSRKLRDFV
jgi:hypothetical protein